ncbi:NitT/TauT family transport system permease protein [Acinetobacter calcoaceticus]|uniref:NitT/TauT family transport system permease protein n=1 Tax=Acinetobacter calcoaceticus TaxID=471 RepID=A0A4R1XEU9_ACICA|nr:NitT/TauT family transport system permease protein [Acinetobacter calcoaceticus]
MSHSQMSHWRYHGLDCLGLLSIFAAWGYFGSFIAEGFFEQFKLQASVSKFIFLIQDAETYNHIGMSIKRVLLGLLIALVLGVPMGLIIGQSQIADAFTSQVFQFLRMISPLSWMPIAVMVLGVGDHPIYFLLAFAAIWPIIINTATGVKAVDPQLLKLAQSLDATAFEMLRHIIWPSVLGHILVGLRLAIGIVWIVLVPSEMLGVSSGLGYFILDARDRLDYTELLSIIFIIGMIGFILDRLVINLQKQLLS